MQLTLINNVLNKEIEFINSLTLSSAQANIARVRVVDLLNRKFNELQSDRLAVTVKYAKIGKDGEPEVVDNHYSFTSAEKEKGWTDETLALLNSNAVIDCTEYESQIKELVKQLNNYNHDMNGDQAQLLVAFLDGINTKEND